MPELGIGMGGDYGDPESAALYMPLKQRLNQLFAEHCAKSYCPTVNEFSMILRVSGKIWNFDSEGVERMRRSHKKRYITVDIVIPEKRWRRVPRHKVRDDFAALVRTALLLEVGRLKKDKENVDEVGFRRDVDKVLNRFLSEDVPTQAVITRPAPSP